MAQWSDEFLRTVLDAAPEGIVVCEVRSGDQPVVYVNAAFEKLTGYSAAELLGQDLRRLQAWDREQEGRAQLREAIGQGGQCRALLRNYRKDGSQFWNEMTVQPLRHENGAVTHFVGFHRDVSERERSSLRRVTGLPTWLREDRLSGLCSRAYFEELLQHDWLSGAREARLVTLVAFDIDELASYNETFGRAAGDACIRRVAGVIGAAFKRGSDVVARWEGGRIIALVRNSDMAVVPSFAASVASKVLGQHIHHPRAARQKFVSVSVGAASVNPTAERGADTLVHAVMRALERAKQDREARVAVAVPEDMQGTN
ncbi:MAG: diguanylate cyclase [Steroidobacteraceae bacterium]|jgi:diguanylate cyclase (GGDEF)-like protein/PAS domain S-box-containing protein